MTTSKLNFLVEFYVTVKFGNLPRLKDDQLIDPTRLEYGPTLTLTAVTVSDTGQYSCRISNDVDDVTSESALLSVQAAADEFCTEHPEPHTLPLPPQCPLPGGSTELDIGKCKELPCRCEALYGVY